MIRNDADRNLLFGVLALQADLLDAARFAEACTAWTSRKETPLADLLVERGWISREDRDDIEKLLRRKLDKHGGDVRASLAEAAGGVADPDVRRTLAELPDPAASLHLRSTIGHQPVSRDRYTLTRLHATGGIGQVWLAHDGKLGRNVALKELRPERSDQGTAGARFLAEARITGQLEHPGIVPVYEVVEPPDGPPFYIMRFVRGQTLEEAIRAYHEKRRKGKSGLLDLQELLGNFLGVGNAVAYAHSRGVVHRDLKPQNVVLGDFGEVIVLDWGLAKVLGGGGPPGLPTPPRADREVRPHETLEGQVLGTPAYMAPEQAAGEVDRIDCRTDVYGLGAILYELLTGEVPFSGGDTQEVLRKVQRERPIAPRTICPGVPRPLQAICVRALAKQPGSRYATVAELARDVKCWLANEPVSAHQEVFSEWLARWSRRHRHLLAGILAVLLVSVLGLATGLVLLRRSNDEIDRQRQEAQHNLLETQHALEHFFVNVSENPQLNTQPGLQPLYRDLLISAIRQYEGMVQRSGTPPSHLSASLARAYFYLGFVTADIGTTDEALAALNKSREHYEVLIDTDPDANFRRRYKDALARVENQTGLVHLNSGKPAEAHTYFDRAIALEEELGASKNPYPYELEELAWCYSNRGIAQRRIGELKEAVRSYEKALERWKSLTQTAPNHAQYGFGLATVTSNLAFHYQETGELGKALQHYQRCLELHRKAKALDEAEAQRSNAQKLKIRAGFALSLGYLGSLYRETGEPDRSRPLFEEARGLLQELVRDNPTLVMPKERLARIHEHLGHLDSDAGQFDAAVLSFEKALKLTAEQPRGDQERIGLRGVAAGCRRGLAQVYRKQGKHAEASKSLREAIALGEQVAHARPSLRYDLACARALASAAEERGLVEQALRDLAAAFADGYRNTPWMRRDPCLDPLRPRGDFQELLRQLEERNRTSR